MTDTVITGLYCDVCKLALNSIRDHTQCIRTEPATSDAVNHPPHYGGADNPFEVIKVLEAWGLESDALPVEHGEVRSARRQERRLARRSEEGALLSRSTHRTHRARAQDRRSSDMSDDITRRLDEKRAAFDRVAALIDAQRNGPTATKVDLYDDIQSAMLLDDAIELFGFGSMTKTDLSASLNTLAMLQGSLAALADERDSLRTDNTHLKSLLDTALHLRRNRCTDADARPDHRGRAQGRTRSRRPHLRHHPRERLRHQPALDARRAHQAGAGARTSLPERVRAGGAVSQTAEKRGHLLLMKGPRSVKEAHGTDLYVISGEHEVALAPAAVTHIYELRVLGGEEDRPACKVHVGTGHVTVFGAFREVVEALYP